MDLILVSVNNNNPGTYLCMLINKYKVSYLYVKMPLYLLRSMLVPVKREAVFG